MFFLNINDSAPLYKQLYTQIREQVLTGKLRAHSRLPSVRDMATELSASRNTVESAYRELYAEGYIYSRERSGYFVSALEPDVPSLTLSPEPHRGIPPLRPVSHYKYDFHPARLDPDSFPRALVRTCFLESLRESSHELTSYGDPRGDWVLRCNIQQYLEHSRGVFCEPEQILVCAGLQYGLEIISPLLKEKYSSVAVEDPGYHLSRAVFRNNLFQIIPIAVGSSGLDLEILKTSAAAVAYVTPSHQMPMGYVMPVAKRLELLEWARSGDNMIIEDDYDSELRYHGKPIPSLQGLQPSGNIIYTGTFSKVLSPALRLSYMVLPHSLLGRFGELYLDYFSSVPLLEQRTMAKFMEQGHWMRHIRRMRVIYKRKHDVLLQAIARSFGARAVVLGQGAGLHVVLQLRRRNHGEAEIIRRAAQNGIGLFPFSATCATGGPAATNLLLGFGGMTTLDIEQGTHLLSQICFS